MTDELRTAFGEQLTAGPPPAFEGVRRRSRRRQRGRMLGAALAVVLVAIVPLGLKIVPSPGRQPAPTLAAAPAAGEASRVGDAVRRLSSYDPRDLAPYTAAIEELTSGQARAGLQGRLRDLRAAPQQHLRVAPGYVTAGLVTRHGTTSTWLVLLDDTPVPRRAQVDDPSGRVTLLGDPVTPEGRPIGFGGLPAPGQGRDIAELLAPTLAAPKGNRDAQDAAVLAGAVDPFAKQWAAGRAARRSELAVSFLPRSRVAVEESDPTTVTALWFVDSFPPFAPGETSSSRPAHTSAWRAKIFKAPAGLRIASLDQLAVKEGNSIVFGFDALSCSSQPPQDPTTLASGSLRGQPWAVLHWSQVERSCAAVSYAGETPGADVSLTLRGTSDVALGPRVTDRLVTGGAPADVRKVDIDVNGVRTTVSTVPVPGTQQRFYGAVLSIASAASVSDTVVWHHDNGRREVLGP